MSIMRPGHLNVHLLLGGVVVGALSMLSWVDQRSELADVNSVTVGAAPPLDRTLVADPERIEHYLQIFEHSKSARIGRVFDELASETSAEVKEEVAEMLAARGDASDYKALFDTYAFGSDERLAAIAQSVMAQLSGPEILKTIENRLASVGDNSEREHLLQAIAISSSDAAVPYLVDKLDSRSQRPLPLLAAERDALLNNGGKQAFQALLRNASYVPDSPEVPLISGLLERSEVAESQALVFLQSAPFEALDTKGVRIAVDILAGANPSPERDRTLFAVSVLHPSEEMRTYASRLVPQPSN